MSLLFNKNFSGPGDIHKLRRGERSNKRLFASNLRRYLDERLHQPARINIRMLQDQTLRQSRARHVEPAIRQLFLQRIHESKRDWCRHVHRCFRSNLKKIATVIFTGRKIRADVLARRFSV